MGCRSLVHGCSFAILALGAVAAPAPRADATATTLASASFEEDTCGAVALPGGSNTVHEDVWESSTTTAGVSEVVAAGSTKRYRLSDVGSVGETRGIRLPLSSEVSSGTLTLEAVATAEQTSSTGGILSVQRPDNDEWICGLSFGGDGKFRVHGASTAVSYNANARYRFRITVHFGQEITVDCKVLDFASGNTLLESNGYTLPGDLVAGAMVFRTGAADIGAFTVDALTAVQ